MHLLRPILALVLVLLTASPAFAREEWYDYYEQALRSLEAGRYEQAEEFLRAALGRKSSSGYFRTYGNNYLRYSPYFHLGVAHQGKGDCRQALQSFVRSAEAGEPDADADLAARLEKLVAECEAALAPPPEPEPVRVVEVEPAPAKPLPPPPAPVDASELERGLRAYLAGDLESAEQAFEALVRSAPDSPDLRLLLGMALHGRWASGGEQDDGLLVRARRELAEAARLDPGLIPDPALCPPRVVALYRSLRSSAGS